MKERVFQMEMKKFPVKFEGKIVGEVESPIFDEKNAEVGLKEIVNYDWTKDGYKNAAEAIVSLVNTQHGTNLRNKLRQANSGRTSAGMIEAMAMAKITMQEFQGCVGDSAAFAALRESKIKEVKRELEEKKNAGKAAGELQADTQEAEDAANTAGE